MSYINCTSCGRPINTDEDEGCYVGDEVLCASCRCGREEQDELFDEEISSERG